MTKDEALRLMHQASSRRTICEVHREIYDACDGLFEPEKTEMRDLVIEAFIMAKKMAGKLCEYKSDWDAGFFGLNPDRRADIYKRTARL